MEKQDSSLLVSAIYIFIGGDVRCSAQDILVFFSGASSIPPLAQWY